MATRADWDGTARRSRYSHVAMLLHWAIAAFILYNLASGLLRDALPRGFFVFHVSSGIMILLLSVVRVVWRLTHKPPPFLPMATWERKLAHVVHFLLYTAMIVVPLTGWAMISANPPIGSPGAAAQQAERAARAAKEAQAAGKPAPPARPRMAPMLWGVVKLPLIAPISEIGRAPEGLAEQQALHEQIEHMHGLGGLIMLALLVLHLGGALKHQFLDREPELARMGLGRAGEPEPLPAE